MAPFVALFDLDGTLVDSQVGILAGFRRALRAVGHDVEESAIRHWIGPPLEQSLLELGVSPTEIPTAISAYRAYYTGAGVYECAPFDGIEAMLSALRDGGVVLAVATAKLVDFARTILEHLALAPYFSAVAGAGQNGLVDKSVIVGDALELLGFPDPQRTVLVGDRRHDVAAARAHEIPAIGATWGYGGEDELRAAGATHLVRSPAELATLVLTELAPTH